MSVEGNTPADRQVFSCISFDIFQELLHLKGKSSKEIADLEGIAQAHYGRANRMSDELNYLRAEHLELKRQVCTYLNIYLIRLIIFL